MPCHCGRRGAAQMLPTLLNSALHSMPRCARDRRASLRIWLLRNLGRSEMLGVCSISTCGWMLATRALNETSQNFAVRKVEV